MDASGGTEREWLEGLDYSTWAFQEDERRDNGSYSDPRKCPRCKFQTVDRDAYWDHLLIHEGESSVVA